MPGEPYAAAGVRPDSAATTAGGRADVRAEGPPKGDTATGGSGGEGKRGLLAACPSSPDRDGFEEAVAATVRDWGRTRKQHKRHKKAITAKQQAQFPQQAGSMKASGQRLRRNPILSGWRGGGVIKPTVLSSSKTFPSS